MNEVICGDSLGVLRTFDDESVDCVITSPPYDNMRDYKGFSFDFEGVARQLYRTLKKGGVIVWVVGDQTVNGSETGTSFRQALFFKDIGLNLHDTMIYSKGKVIFPDPTRYHQIFEYMFILSKGKPKTINLLKDRKNIHHGSWGKRNYRDKNGTLVKGEKLHDFEENGVRNNIWTILNGFQHTTQDKFAFEHPAMFPEKLAEGHILTWTKEGDVVLDPFVGSGTTLKMAKQHGRQFIGIDISPEYCEIARKRIAQEVLFSPKLLSTVISKSSK